MRIGVVGAFYLRDRDADDLGFTFIKRIPRRHLHFWVGNMQTRTMNTLNSVPVKRGEYLSDMTDNSVLYLFVARRALIIRTCCHPSDTDSRKYMLDGLTGEYLVSIWIVCEDRSLVTVAPQAGCTLPVFLRRLCCSDVVVRIFIGIYKLTPMVVKNEDDYYLFMGSDPAAICALSGDDSGITGVVRQVAEC